MNASKLLALLATLTVFTALSLHAAAEQCPGLLVEPTWATPYAVKPGDTFTIKLSEPVGVERVYATNGTVNVTLEIVSQSERELVVRVGDAAPGLYDLVLVLTDGRICGEHGAVWVIGSIDELTTLHTSDTHFGVITFRPAESYVLATIILANSNPDIQVVLHTGDLADTASVEEYLRARLYYMLLEKPIFVCPGNHDHVTGPKNYQTYVGPLRWVRSVGPYTLVALDSGYEGFITIEQGKWARNTLVNATNAIVLVHHPLFAYVYGDTPHEFTVASSDELLELLKTRKPGSRYPYIYTSWLENEEALKLLLDGIYYGDVIAVLAGHIHLDSYTRVHRSEGGYIDFIVTTTTGGPVREGDYHGVKIIVFSDEGVKEIRGADVPWSRHASYSIEGLIAFLVSNENATSVVTVVADKSLLELLPRLKLAVPLLTEGAEKIYAPGFEKTWKRCTPAGCVVYGVTPEAPQLGKVYVLAVYRVEDHEPPKVVINAPERVAANKPIPVEVRVADDSWGVAFANVTIYYGGKVISTIPPIIEGRIVLNLPPLGSPGKVKIVVEAYDASGKKTVAEKTVEVVEVKKPTPTQTPTTTPTIIQTSTATPTQTPTPTPTETKPATPVKAKITLPEITVPTLKPVKIAPQAPTIGPAIAIVAVAAAAAAVAIAFSLRRRS